MTDGWRQERRAEIDAVFASATRGDSEHFVSPSGTYKLSITKCVNERGWSYSLGEVRAETTGTLIATVKRNFNHFPFSWCEGHPNGHDYLLCGEDYQGQTVIELDTGTRVDHLEDAAERGGGFCWTDHFVSADSQILFVEGCYWACPYMIVAFDFSDPLALPYPVLHLSEDLVKVEGFDADANFTWTTSVDVRISDSTPIDDLSADETAALRGSDRRFLPDSVATQRHRHTWRPGTPLSEISTQLIGLDSEP